MAFEAFSWLDATVYVSTGFAFGTSGVVALAENTNITTQWGWVNTPAADGTYYDHLTGQRANVNAQVIYTIDRTLLNIADSATALHMKFIHSAANGTAGMVLYSGRIDNINYIGQKGGLFMVALQAHFNSFSGF